MGAARARGTLNQRMAQPKGGAWKAMVGTPSVGNIAPFELQRVKKENEDGTTSVAFKKRTLKAGTRIKSLDGRTQYVYDGTQVRRVR